MPLTDPDHDLLFVPTIGLPKHGEPHPSRDADDPPARHHETQSAAPMCSYYASLEGEQRHGTSDW